MNDCSWPDADFIRKGILVKYILIFILVFISGCSEKDWVPPNNPDPSDILKQASNDTRSGNYKDALSKHIWFHENALEYRQSLTGVRLSFALGDWHDLAKKYPPAMRALVAAGDTALGNVQKEIDTFNAFHDYSSINRELDTMAKTVELFIWLDKNHPKQARKVYPIAQEALIEAKQYSLSGKYIEPQRTFLKAIRVVEVLKRSYASTDANSNREDRAYWHFSESIPTLVALLILNNRKEEAEELVEQALLEWENAGFKRKLNIALEGKFLYE